MATQGTWQLAVTFCLTPIRHVLLTLCEAKCNFHHVLMIHNIPHPIVQIYQIHTKALKALAQSHASIAKNSESGIPPSMQKARRDRSAVPCRLSMTGNVPPAISLYLQLCVALTSQA